MPCDDAMPKQCIVLDRECRTAPYYLRVEEGDRVRHVELADANGAAMSLPAAVAASEREGYHPTHSMEVGHSPWPIPASVSRRPGSRPR